MTVVVLKRIRNEYTRSDILLHQEKFVSMAKVRGTTHPFSFAWVGSRGYITLVRMMNAAILPNNIGGRVSE